MKEFLTLREIAAMYHVSERHLYRLKAKGVLPPPICIGRCHRWDPEEFRYFFEKSANNRVARERRKVGW
jgi:predicted DNA-binding transcriptional regulator AlpA